MKKIGQQFASSPPGGQFEKFLVFPIVTIVWNSIGHNFAKNASIVMKISQNLYFGIFFPLQQEKFEKFKIEGFSIVKYFFYCSLIFK